MDLQYFICDEAKNESSFNELRGVPRIKSVPPPDSPLAYNEEDLVGILTDIYNHFADVLYIQGHVSFPPADTGRHSLNVEYLRDELHMTARVTSLLERLPYADFNRWERWEWLPRARFVDYRDMKSARFARDPGGISMYAGFRDDIHSRLNFLRPGDVALSIAADGDCRGTIILDTEASK